MSQLIVIARNLINSPEYVFNIASVWIMKCKIAKLINVMSKSLIITELSFSSLKYMQWISALSVNIFIFIKKDILVLFSVNKYV
jgi:hypothetical protein